MLLVLSARLWLVRGFVKFLPAVAYQFCLNLPVKFIQSCESHKQAPISAKNSTAKYDEIHLAFVPESEPLPAGALLELDGGDLH